MCSFAPGKAAEFTRRKRQRERAMSEMIGKQRTKERQIGLKLAEIKSLEESIKSISSNEMKMELQIIWIRRYPTGLPQVQKTERAFAEGLYRREADQSYYARGNSNFNGPDPWDW